MNADRSVERSWERIQAKVDASERLSREEGSLLMRREVPLHEVGELANRVRERINGNLAYYNMNAHLNPTNVCVNQCAFCGFRANLDDQKAYVMSDQQILARGREALESGCTELHVVSGLHPRRGFDWYVHIVRLLHDAFPAIHLKAWTAVEIEWFERVAKKPARAVLKELIEAGVGSLPGGGAEIFHPTVREKICPHKAGAGKWLEIHRIAHQLGLRTTCTMLYGHVENEEHRVDHLVRLRDLQDETGGFQTFVPLACHPRNTRLSHLTRASALTDLRVMAVSRLMLDNIPHLKAYWIMMGAGTAQVALAYGADDLDGTVRHESIYHDAGATTPEVLSVGEIRRLIREAGRDPVERDTLYRYVVRAAAEPAAWNVGPPILATT